MEPKTKTESEIEKIVADVISAGGEPTEIAGVIDDVIFDWLDDAIYGNRSSIGEYQIGRMLVLKHVRDMFTKIASIQNN